MKPLRTTTSSYNYLIYYLPSVPINGSIIDAFEYFFAIYELNKNFKMIILGFSDRNKKEIDELLNDRYNLKGIENFWNNIIPMRLRDILKVKIDKALILNYETAMKLKGLINCNKIVVICETTDKNRNANLNRDIYNVTHYGEMPFDDFDIQYNLKILLHRFKSIKKCDKAIYINSPENSNKSFIDTLDIEGKKIIFKERKHLNRMFEKFETYIYYHANKWFDPHPRLFIECSFYQKEIFYFNEYGIKDGSYYRYKDLCENGIEHRFFNSDDEILREFL